MGGSPTGHSTSANAESIEFKAQLLFSDSPLPTFFCLMLCSVFVSDSSPPSVAYADVEENIPVNAAAIRTAAIAIVLYIAKNNRCDHISVEKLSAGVSRVILSQYLEGLEYDYKI